VIRSQRKLEARERRERIAHFDRLVAECDVREEEGRIRRLAVARWSMPDVPSMTDGRKLAADLAARPGRGHRLSGREEEARSRLAALRPELERRVSAHRAIREEVVGLREAGTRERP
jgi:hypothetical protein